MGIFDDTASIISRKSGGHSTRHHRHSTSSSHHHHNNNKRYSTHSRKSSRSRSPGARSIAASFLGIGDDNHQRSSSRRRSSRSRSRHRSSRSGASGFFGLPNVSSASFFGNFGHEKHRSSTSSYRRSPRPNFLTRAYKQLKRLLRDLAYYARRHPLKVFTLVVLPLLTGGALTALLARFGLRLPPAVERMLGLGARAMSGDTVGLVGEAVRMAGAGSSSRTSVERGWDGGLQWERKRSTWDSGDYGRGDAAASAAVGGGWGEGMMRSVRNFFD